MKQTDFHTLIKQSISVIHYLETDTTEAAEAECEMWQRDDCTLLIDFHQPINQIDVLKNIFTVIAQQIDFLNQARDEILQTLITQQPSLTTDEARMVYLAFGVESADAIWCDFAVSVPDFGECLATFSLENGNHVIFEGIE